MSMNPYYNHNPHLFGDEWFQAGQVLSGAEEEQPAPPPRAPVRKRRRRQPEADAAQAQAPKQPRVAPPIDELAAAKTKKALEGMARQLEASLHEMTSSGYKTTLVISGEHNSTVKIFPIGPEDKERQATRRNIATQLGIFVQRVPVGSAMCTVEAVINGDTKTVMELTAE